MGDLGSSPSASSDSVAEQDLLGSDRLGALRADPSGSDDRRG